MAKHAYLIITHKIDFTLKTLLSLLDDERNDIFLHVDKKTVGFQESDVEGIVTKGSLHVLKHRLDVRWGHHSCAFVIVEEDNLLPRRQPFQPILQGKERIRPALDPALALHPLPFKRIGEFIQLHPLVTLRKSRMLKSKRIVERLLNEECLSNPSPTIDCDKL